MNGSLHHHPIERWAAVVSAVQVRHLLADEFGIHRRLDLVQQVLLRHAFLECHHLEFVPGGYRPLRHDAHETAKPKAGPWALSAV